METNYTEKIKELNATIKQKEKKFRQEKSKYMQKVIEKSDLEHLFVDAVEDVRKEIMHRRLKDEMTARKGPRKPSSQQDAQEIEDSL